MSDKERKGVENLVVYDIWNLELQDVGVFDCGISLAPLLYCHEEKQSATRWDMQLYLGAEVLELLVLAKPAPGPGMVSAGIYGFLRFRRTPVEIVSDWLCEHRFMITRMYLRYEIEVQPDTSVQPLPSGLLVVDGQVQIRRWSARVWFPGPGLLMAPTPHAVPRQRLRGSHLTIFRR
nr:hypothetical protein Iba_chr05fCG12300 [Ipomoea batatas]